MTVASSWPTTIASSHYIVRTNRDNESRKLGHRFDLIDIIMPTQKGPIPTPLLVKHILVFDGLQGGVICKYYAWYKMLASALWYAVVTNQ